MATLRLSGWAQVEPSTRGTMQRTLGMFEQLYGTSVEEVPVPFGATLGKLRDLYELGDLPDVMQLSGHWSHYLGQKGLLASLSAEPYSLRAEIPQLFRDSFPGAMEGGALNGTLYAAPFSIVPLGLWYNRKLLEDAKIELKSTPWTIEEFDDILLQLRDATKNKIEFYPIRIDVSSGEYAVTRFWPWIWSFGGDPMRADASGKLTYDWTDTGTVAAFTWLQKVTARPNLLLPVRAAWQDRQLFAQDKIAFLLDGPYMVSQIAYLNPAYSTRSSIDEAFGVTTPPVPNAGDPPVTALDLHQLAIARGPQNPLLARKLVRFLTTNELSIRTYHIPQGGLLPVRGDNTGKYAADYNDGIGRAFLQQIVPCMRLPPFSPWYGTAARIVTRVLQEIVLLNASSIERRLERLNGELDEALANDDMI